MIKYEANVRHAGPWAVAGVKIPEILAPYAVSAIEARAIARWGHECNTMHPDERMEPIKFEYDREYLKNIVERYGADDWKPAWERSVRTKD